MAEAVVSFVLERLGDFLIDEAKFIHGVGGKAQEIYDELRWMKAFLRDADAKLNEEQRIREWVADVRALAYDAGDVLESFVFRSESKRGGIMKNILKRYVCVLNECVALRKTGSEIQDIEARISGLKSRLETYGIRSLSEAEGSSSFAGERQSQLRRTYSHIVQDDFVGLEGDVEKLVGHLVSIDDKDGDECYSVVSICGMGGLGKTTIAKKVYHHAKVRRHFDALAWACISQKWQLTDILRQILNKIVPAEEKDQIIKLRDAELIKKLFDIQQEKICLVVLDDIWSMDAWNCLKNAFPLENTKSKLLLTSRNTEVALYVNPEGFLHQPQLLNEDESWLLLKKKAFSKRHHTDPEEAKEQEKLGIEMARQCGGLPLAIVVLGGILITKHSLREWEKVRQNIRSFLRHGEGLRLHQGGVLDILALSYNDLPYQLKPCFAYLGKFQEDSDIEVERLYQLWMAESMVLSEDRKDGETMMDVAECYLGELAQRCMVQVQLEEEGCGFAKFSSCRLHDMVRDLCLSKAKEEDFFYAIDFQNGNISEHVGSSSSFADKARRVVIYSQEENTSSRDFSVNKKTSQHLRSLLVFNEPVGYQGRMPRIVNSRLKDFKLLRVLAIEAIEGFYLYRGQLTLTKFTKDVLLNHFALPKAIGSLIHLRYLSLRGTSFVMFLSSIENLKHLQTLDLRGVYLSYFQCKENVLGKMRQLRHLYFSREMVRSFKASNLRLDGSTNLEILENFDPSWCKSEDLIKLTNLRKLTAIVKLQNLKGAEEIISVLMNTNFRCIKYSSLSFEECNFALEEWQTILIQLLGTGCVHELDIDGSLVNKLPRYNNISTFPSRLTNLTLRRFKVVEDPMPILGALPNLRSLFLISAFEGNEMVCSSNGFLQLRTLRLWRLNNFQSWGIEDGAMPKLSRLLFYGCSRLRMIPNGLRFITTLQELKVISMPEEFSQRVQAVVDGEKGEDFEKIGHIASIYFSMN
ncbi:hypothetical protein LguiB_013401 [Lonicera macranthoides]